MKKISSLLVVLLLMLASFTANAQGLYGDVNWDGVVNISDVNAVIGVILGDHTPTPPPVDEHKWVDLGLASGTLWATCNVGATNPEDYGNRFAWGETEPKDVYDWSTYKWYYEDSTGDCFSKYCFGGDFGGTVDYKKELDLADDAAYVNWGPLWRMPTVEQQQELIKNCTWTWTQQNGVNGRLVTGPNGNTIFLPAEGLYGCCWSRTLNSDRSSRAYGLYIDSGDVIYWYHNNRDNGCSVRAVRVSQD